MKHNLWLPILAAALLAGLTPAGPAAAAPPQQASSCDGGEGVYLYEHARFGGRCLKFTGDHADLSGLSFNNVASSIRFVGSWTATLYVDQNYSGTSSTFVGDDTDLRDNVVGTDQASSIRVRRGIEEGVPSENRCNGDAGAYLYEHTNFRGRCVRLTRDTTDLSDLLFNNIVSSVEIIGDYSLTLYVDQGYGGTATTFTGNDADIGDTPIGENRASSARVRGGSTPEVSRCSGGGEGVYLYEHPQYGGRCVRVASHVGDIRALGFDDMASSVEIVGSWSVTLYGDLNLTGPQSTFTASDPNLADDTIGDNRVTSLRVVRGSAMPEMSRCSGGGEGVYLYEHPQYGGRCVRVASDVGDIRALGFDDMASSVEIVGNWSVTLYGDLNLTGPQSTFTASDPNLVDDTIGDNRVTSLRVVRGAAPPEANRCDGGEGVYLYEHPNFQGRCLRLTADAPDLRVFAFDDTASSVRVSAGWSVTLFRDLSGFGGSSSLRRDDANLADDAIGDNQATSAVVRRTP